jgi:hypothetical protein
MRGRRAHYRLSVSDMMFEKNKNQSVYYVGIFRSQSESVDVKQS